MRSYPEASIPDEKDPEFLVLVRARIFSGIRRSPDWLVGLKLLGHFSQCQKQLGVLQHMLGHLEKGMPFMINKPEIDLIAPVLERNASHESPAFTYHPDDPMIQDNPAVLEQARIAASNPDQDVLLNVFLDRKKLRAALRCQAVPRNKRRYTWMTVLRRYIGWLNVEIAEWNRLLWDWLDRNPDIVRGLREGDSVDDASPPD